ncbi:hypothetical protein BVG79_01077 [Ketogulonicigenium robustum]|uniref:Uncharacterized protein n=1 Tax=Ketogulonicigenium robustum TaxID=92947 RepID=A0A1W6NZ45_9RHOB|nr:hypothetical protein [Ketogulonicigenium robustum]ARO14423.1 hypothetical protein BVG79_01077 [Ketogulonicigenium robustum]
MSRETEINDQIARFLVRYSPPRTMAENLDAQRDEIRRITRIVVQHAPNVGYVEWVATLIDQIEVGMTTRSWPLIGEVNKACEALRKEGFLSRPVLKDPHVEEHGHYAKLADRIKAGEPVAESVLYGVEAVEMIKRNLLTEGDLRKHRSAAYFARKATYGEEAAEVWEDGRKALHERCMAEYDTIVAQRAIPRAGRKGFSPNMPSMPYSDGFAA